MFTYVHGGKFGMPAKITPLDNSSLKSIPSINLPLQTAKSIAPLPLACYL